MERSVAESLQRVMWQAHAVNKRVEVAMTKTTATGARYALDICSGFAFPESAHLTFTAVQSGQSNLLRSQSGNSYVLTSCLRRDHLVAGAPIHSGQPQPIDR